MQFIAKRLLTTVFSAGIFVIVASSASSQPVPTAHGRAPGQVTTVTPQRRATGNTSSDPRAHDFTVDQAPTTAR